MFGSEPDLKIIVQNMGVPPLKVGPNNCLFSDGFTTPRFKSANRANIFVRKQAIDKRRRIFNYTTASLRMLELW